MRIINDKVLVTNYGTPYLGQQILAATLLKNIQSLGFTLSKDLFVAISGMTETQIDDLADKLIYYLRKKVGAHVKYNPMYPNFPKQVIDATSFELLMNALVHYWFGILPDYEKVNRALYDEQSKFTVIDILKEEDAIAYFKQLLNSKVEYSDNIKEEIAANQDLIKPILSSIDEIPNKENLAFLSKYFDISRFFKTTTDVLRYAVMLSDGDISLAENTRFKKLSREKRRQILSMFESCINAEEMKIRREVFLRLGEILHPGEYKRQFPDTAKAFKLLRDNQVKSFFSKVEDLFSSGQIINAAKLLATRPGNLARNMHRLLRNAKINDREAILKIFESVANGISTKVLLQTRSRFLSATDKRLIIPKGKVAKAFITDNPVENFIIEKKTKAKVIDIINNALIKIYADRNNIPAGSKVYISPELQNYTIPFSLRSASRSIRTIGRGSVFNFDNTKTLRFFIYWKDNSESKDYLGYEICDNSQRIDIDLSAQYLNEAMQTTNWTSWTNLRSNFAYHSGDITRAPNGAAEFIDINCKEALANGIRYIVPQVYSFTYQKFCDMSECFFGWMERKNPNSGEIFEPKSVKEKIDLVNGARTNHPVLIDLFRGKIYWMDMEVTQERITERAFTRTAEVASAIIQMTKPTVYELLKFNAKGQCIIIRNRQKADVVFDEDFAYNTAEIIGKYL